MQLNKKNIQFLRTMCKNQHIHYNVFTFQSFITVFNKEYLHQTPIQAHI